MTSLFSHLKSAVRAWRSERRDRQLLKTFLSSPVQRTATMMSASPAARFLMIELEDFARSREPRGELINYSIVSNSRAGERPRLPGSMSSDWYGLLYSVAGEGEYFVFATDKGPVRIRFTQPLAPFPPIPRVVDDLTDESMKELLKADDDLIMAFSESSKFIFTRKPD